MKRFLCIVLPLLMILGIFPVSAVTKPAGIAENEVINIIRILEIMNGDQYGNLNLDNNVTRAEFVKMAICASSYKNTRALAVTTSQFPDVRANHWAAGYIATATNAGLINGYLDGTFRPDSNVRLEEAVTIALKLLGYTSGDLTGQYPDVQLSKYASLKMNTNISASKGENMTRRDCMYLFYNLFCTEAKNGQNYASMMGYSVDADGNIDYLKLITGEMSEALTVDAENTWTSKLPFPLDEATVYRDGKKANSAAISENDIIYYSDILKTIWCYSDKATGILTAISPNKNSPSSVTVNGKSYMLGNNSVIYKFSTMGNLDTGDFVTLLLGKDGIAEDVILRDVNDYSLYADGEIDYTALVNSTMEGPIVVTDNSWKEKIGFDAANAAYYKQNNRVSIENVALYSVIYYSKTFKAVWIYDKKVSGIIEKISPDRTAPSSVTLSGVEYKLEQNSAVSLELSNKGSFTVGDTVTLLLGKDSTAAGILDAAKINSETFGMVTLLSKKTYTDNDGNEYTSYYISVKDLSGNTFEFPTENRFLDEGDFVSITYRDGVQEISEIREVYNDIENLKWAVKNGDFAPEAKLADVYKTSMISIFPSRLRDVSLKASDVLYYRMNSSGQITQLVLNDFTGDIHTYGILTNSSEKTSGGASGTYTYISGSKTSTVQTSAVFFLSSGAVCIRKSNNSVDKISALQSMTLSQVSQTSVTSGAYSYPVWDKAAAYIYTSSDTYEPVAIDEISDTAKYNVKAYYDKLPTAGGRIRILVATLK